MKTIRQALGRFFLLLFQNALQIRDPNADGASNHTQNSGRILCAKHTMPQRFQKVKWKDPVTGNSTKFLFFSDNMRKT
jgi:hypothetical protein